MAVDADLILSLTLTVNLAAIQVRVNETTQRPLLFT